MGRDSSKFNPEARQVNEVMKSSSPGLAKLLRHARQIQFLDKKLEGLLEAGMSEQVRVAAVQDNCLILITPSAALATRLRMDSDYLLRALEAAGVQGISQLKIRIAPLAKPKEVERKPRELPEIARLSLQRFAEDTADDTPTEPIQDPAKE